MKKSKRIAIIAFMLALTAIFCFVPVPIGPVTLGLMIVPTLIAAQATDFKTTLAIAIFLGLVNQIAWFTTKAALPTAPVFQNPLVCILPRVMIGVVSWAVYHGMCRLMRVTPCGWGKVRSCPVADKPDEQAEVQPARPTRRDMVLKQVASVLAAASGVITNTLLVGVFTVLLFRGQMIGTTVIEPQYILALFGVNFAVEVIVFPIIVPPIVYAVDRSK